MQSELLIDWIESYSSLYWSFCTYIILLGASCILSYHMFKEDKAESTLDQLWEDGMQPPNG